MKPIGAEKQRQNKSEKEGGGGRKCNKKQAEKGGKGNKKNCNTKKGE
jgi:hypothetical protein